MTPTRGGRTAGKATRPPRSLLPGKSYRQKRKASGTPIAAAVTTVATEIHTLPHRAFASLRRLKNSRRKSRVHPLGPRKPSISTSTRGYRISQARKTRRTPALRPDFALVFIGLAPGKDECRHRRGGWAECRSGHPRTRREEGRSPPALHRC